MHFIDSVLFYYFLLAVLYIAVLSVAALFGKAKTFPESTSFKRICVLVPCYKEDGIMMSVAKALLQANYPKEYFDIVIIADSFKHETLEQLRTLPIIVIDPKLEKSSKANSLNYAMSNLPKSYDVALISDADNVYEKDFLKKINNAFAAGCVIVQGQRVAKNLNTSYAILDAASEIINNHLFRKGSNALGLSASIIGSGLAVDYELLRTELGKIDTVDEDKPLQLNLFETRNKIYYLEGALIYDEKVSTSAAFQNQRRRWLSSQFYYFKKFFVKGFRLLLKGNIDYFNHAIIHNIFPPRALLLLSLVVFSILFTAIPPHDGLRWWILFLVYILALAVALPLKFLSKDFFKAVSHLPFALFRMVQALLGVKKTQENIHTEHTEISIDNPLFKNNDGE